MDAKTDPNIGQNIRRERKRLGLTGEDVRRLAGIDPTSLSFFERGVREPRLYHLRRLSEAFGVPIMRLLARPVVRRSRPSRQPSDHTS